MCASNAVGKRQGNEEAHGKRGRRAKIGERGGKLCKEWRRSTAFQACVFRLLFLICVHIWNIFLRVPSKVPQPPAVRLFVRHPSKGGEKTA